MGVCLLDGFREEDNRTDQMRGRSKQRAVGSGRPGGAGKAYSEFWSQSSEFRICASWKA